ncbi:PREDICTED: annulin-like [Wasmannia auropunctata]|uniref:annulin-like n=1 Tax=Wasmannia auropunctata TaxID=64793 RepID=UPI0005EFC115|nr:PREDICTED: annulin-like [Wasmannia auropunctata]
MRILSPKHGFADDYSALVLRQEWGMCPRGCSGRYIATCVNVTSATSLAKKNDLPLLTIHNVDLCTKENGENHRTSRYELMTRGDDRARLVVRRGQEFYLHLNLSQNYNSSTDTIFIFFTLDGVRSQPGHGTLVTIAVHEPTHISEAVWQAIIDVNGTNFVRIKVVTSANAIIGKWKMNIDTYHKKLIRTVSYMMDHPFYLICNPWCNDDVVYLDSENERQEYVLMEDGLIWRGNHNRWRPTVWKYAQFEQDILDCALYLMNHVGKVRIYGRNHPVIITRCLSAAVNSPDNNGAMIGNWSDDYEDGVPPTRWMGSQQILQQYYKTKKPVKYGQCWVFSGVLATICRTLGIPCRVVTNYSSAHITQNSRIVECVINKDGKIMEELSDSVWNFHVWNEVWMKRPDLSPDYSGWQAIDATRKELRDGAYRCGPASVAAVKKGELLHPYDNAFVFAQVNADKIYRPLDRVYPKCNGSMQLKHLKSIGRDKCCTGRLICTKAVGNWIMEDITHTYKYPEKSEEYGVILNALLQHKTSYLDGYYYPYEKFNIKFTFELRDDIIIGQPFSVALLISNQHSMMEYRVSVILRAETASYTGRGGIQVKKLHTDRLVRPETVEEICMDICWMEYGPRLLDQCSFNITCLATVEDTDFEYFVQEDFRVRKPDIKITLHDDAIVGQTLRATAKFRNPLPIPLRKGRFLIEGPGLDKQLKLKLSKPVEVDADAECSFSVIPKLEGRAMIAAKFYSIELDDVDGYSNDFIVKSANQ